MNLSEQIYSDFTQKLLPKVQEGLVIAKDYFQDLFGRYVQYLIIIDTAQVIAGVLIIIVDIILARKFWRHTQNSKNDEVDQLFVVLFVFVPITITGAYLLMNGGTNLLKDVFIPEIRILEILRAIK